MPRSLDTRAYAQKAQGEKERASEREREREREMCSACTETCVRRKEKVVETSVGGDLEKLAANGGGGANGVVFACIHFGNRMGSRAKIIVQRVEWNRRRDALQRTSAFYVVVATNRAQHRRSTALGRFFAIRHTREPLRVRTAASSDSSGVGARTLRANGPHIYIVRQPRSGPLLSSRSHQIVGEHVAPVGALFDQCP